MQTRGLLTGLLLGLSIFALGCGGGDKPAESADSKAEEAKPEPEAKGDDKAEGADASDDKKSDDKKADDKKSDDKATDKKADEKKADEGGPKPTRTPADILQAPDTVFLFSFNDSEPMKAAEEKCDKKAPNDPKKKNECMAGARKQFADEGHRFTKDDKDQWWWITVHKTGNKLVEVHKIPVEFGEATGTSITLKTTGKDKGKKPFANPPAKVVFEVPNDYQIAMKDPKHGRLVFQAKVGSLSEK